VLQSPKLLFMMIRPDAAAAALGGYAGRRLSRPIGRTLPQIATGGYDGQRSLAVLPWRQNWRMIPVTL